MQDSTTFEKDEIVFAVSKGKTVGYEVEHLKENIENDEYAVSEKEQKTGEAGKNTSAEAKPYEGFKAQSFTQTVIKADGSTVVQIKYKRNVVSLILDLDGGNTSTTLKNGEGGKKLLEGKFGAIVEVKELKKERFKFEEWEPALPHTFPATNPNATYKAKWKKLICYVTIAGDERVKVAEPEYIDVTILKTFGDIKAEILKKTSLKAEWPDVDYTFYDWRIGGEDGEEMLDTTPIKDDMVIYARTNYKRFKVTGTKLEGYEGEKPKGWIFIPKEITEIGKDAFNNCNELKTVNLSGCVEIVNIEEGAFRSCKSLESIDLSPCTKLTKIGKGAFYSCSELKTVNLSGCTELMSLEGGTIAGNGYGSFSSCKSIESIDLSSCTKLKDIGVGAFDKCIKLKTIDLSSCTKLESITRLDFSGCSKAEVKLPTSIKEINEAAFGKDSTDYCNKVLVPNETIKQLVIASKYPEGRIKLY
ncbi:MAG: leucine-rich repeat domain-containing protein [Treponema sp.]